MITLEQRATLQNFDNWTKALFNASGSLFRKPVPFSAIPHVDAHGNVTIDHGRMVLSFPDDDIEMFHLWSVDQGQRTLIASGSSLEGILIQGLQWSIFRSFANSYTS